MDKPLSSFVTPLLTDLYQIRMAYSYWKLKTHDITAAFELYFRVAPLKGQFAIFGGIEETLKHLANFRFSSEDVAFCRRQFGEEDVEEGFFEWLLTLDCSAITIRSLKEGTICFPNEPLITVEGPLAVCQLIETTLLNLVNFSTLVATNAMQMRLAAGPNDVLMELGLRRAQGPDGGMTASKYAYIGGFDSTSNVLAGKLFDIPVVGTMAHSFILSFDVEQESSVLPKLTLKRKSDQSVVSLYEEAKSALEHILSLNCLPEDGLVISPDPNELMAFTAFSCTHPNNAVMLVDTFDTLRSGVPNFLAVALALHRLGYKAIGIRLDSGDLADLSKKARRMFERTSVALGEGFDFFTKFAIAASNDLNCQKIKELKRDDCEVNVFGIGTNLVTCQEQPALGGVYKLVSVRGHPRIKLSQEAAKTSIPGLKLIFRVKLSEPVNLSAAGGQYSQHESISQLDLLAYDQDEVLSSPLQAFVPFAFDHPICLQVASIEPILQVAWNGGSADQSFFSPLSQVRQFALDSTRGLDARHTAPEGALKYPVLISPKVSQTLSSLFLHRSRN